MKYFYLIFALLSFTLNAGPTGFGDQPSTKEPPQGFHSKQKKNTIKGVLEKAHNGDYVLLDGQFIKKKDEFTYIFSDLTNNKKHVIDVIISDTHIVPLENAKYLIWGTYQKTFFKKAIDIEFISQPRPLK